MAFKRGTTLPETEHRHIDCAHAPHCTRSAVIRERTVTGMANFCLQHYFENLERERNARWIAAGRPTREQSLAKMRGLFIKTVVGGRYQGERDAGQDDEESTAGPV